MTDMAVHNGLIGHHCLRILHELVAAPLGVVGQARLDLQQGASKHNPVNLKVRATPSTGPLLRLLQQL